LMGICDRLEVARKEREAIRDGFTTSTLGRLSVANESTFQSDASFAIEHLRELTTRPDQIKQLRQTILNLAVRGKLVPQDPNDEPASELQKRIDVAYRNSNKLKSKHEKKRIVPIAKQDVPSDLPDSWVWARFGDVTISRDGERIPVSKVERSQKAKLYDYYGASGVIDKIDGYLFDKPLLLIGEDGANLINRSTPIAFIAEGKYWVNNHAHVIDGFSLDFLRYLELFMNAIDLKPYVTGTAQPKMNQAKMNSIPIALPPLQEQRRIVEQVNGLISLCDHLETSLRFTNTNSDRLLNELVRSAVN
jgi:type I restriction enzyme S subunit